MSAFLNFEDILIAVAAIENLIFLETLDESLRRLLYQRTALRRLPLELTQRNISLPLKFLTLKLQRHLSSILQSFTHLHSFFLQRLIHDVLR